MRPAEAPLPRLPLEVPVEVPRMRRGSLPETYQNWGWFMKLALPTRTSYFIKVAYIGILFTKVICLSYFNCFMKCDSRCDVAYYSYSIHLRLSKALVIQASWWHCWWAIWDLHLLSALLGKDLFILGTNLYCMFKFQIEVFPLVWYTRAFHWCRKYAGSRSGESSKSQLKIGSILVGKYRTTIHFGGHNIPYSMNEQSATQPKNQVKVRGKIVPPHPKTLKKKQGWNWNIEQRNIKTIRSNNERWDVPASLYHPLPFFHLFSYIPTDTPWPAHP